MRLPKNFFQKEGSPYIWTRYYSKQLKRSRAISTGLALNPLNIKLARAFREQKIKEDKAPRIIYRGDSQTISEGLETFFQSKTLSESSVTLHKRAVYYFIEACGDMVIRNITDENWEKVTKHWADKIKHNSQSIYSRSLSGLFNFFIGKRWLEGNPITVIPVRNGKPKSIPADKLKEIFDYMALHNSEAYNFYRFLHLSGLRISEALALKWENIDLEKGIMSFWNGKESRFDDVPLLEDTLNHLKFVKAMSGNKEKPFIYTHRGGHVFYRTQAQLWGERDQNGHLKSKTLHTYNIHQLRKTFISDLVDSGVAKGDTKLLARHRDYRTTEKNYIDQDLKKTADRVNAKVIFRV